MDADCIDRRSWHERERGRRGRGEEGKRGPRSAESCTQVHQVHLNAKQNKVSTEQKIDKAACWCLCCELVEEAQALK